MPKIIAAILLIGWTIFLLYPSSSEQNTQALVAKRNIFVGERILPSDFVTKSVILGDSAAIYLNPEQLPAGATAGREVLAGELLTKTSVERPNTSPIPLAVQLTLAPASQIEVGSSVDVWATTIHQGQVEGLPEPIVLDARVSAIKSSSNLGQERSIVEVLVRQEFVAQLLLAQADGSVLSLVLNPSLANPQ